MPRIDDALLDCVIYLYASKAEADAGINIGGSGFLVGYPSSKGLAAGGFIYAVTNRHIIREKCTTVRLNTADGRTDVFVYSPADWTCSDTDDLAVKTLPGTLSGTEYRFRLITTRAFLTKELVTFFDIGVGDEVAVLGRFINIEGKQRNIPTGRFGHIAQMPLEPIESLDQGVPYEQETFLADIKSIGGYSGSPVIWDIEAAPYNHTKRRVDLAVSHGVTNKSYLLGIDWAHIRDWEPISGPDRRPLSMGHQVELNTGIAAIVPAWRLLDLLENHPMLKKEREKAEDAYFASVAKPDGSFGVAPSEESVSGTNPNQLADFARLVDVAARKRPQGGET